MITLLQKLGKLLRGGAGGREIFLGAMIGVMLGMIPGFNFTMALGIMLILVLNANIGLVTLGFAIGKVACYALAPYTFRLGFHAIHGLGLEEMVISASGTPILALFDLDYYCLIGGIPIGIIVGMVFGATFAKLIVGLRKKIVDAKENNEKFQKLSEKKFAKFLVWLFFGKSKFDMKETLEKDSPFLRKKGIIVAVTILVILLGVELLAFKFGAKAGLEYALGRANGAEVSIGAAELSIFSGTVYLADVRATDPQKPTHDQLQADEITADIGIVDLLTRKYVIDRIAVGNFRTDVKRDKPGEVYPSERDDDDDDKKGDDKGEADKTGIDQIAEYIENWEKYKGYLDKGYHYLKKANAKRKAYKDLKTAKDPVKMMAQLEALAANSGYLSLSARPFLVTEPGWLVHEVETPTFDVGNSLPQQKLLINEISGAPYLHDKPIKMVLTPGKDATPLLDTELNFLSDDAMHKAQINADNLPLDKVLKSGGKISLDIQDGKGKMTAGGEFNEENMDLALQLGITDLKAKPIAGKKFMGMESGQADMLLQNLTTLNLKGRIYGPINEPKFKLDDNDLFGAMKDQMMNAAKARLEAEAQKELDRAKAKAKSKAQEKLKEEVGDKITEELGSEAGKQVTDALGDNAGGLMGGLLGGDKKTEEKKEQDEEKKEQDEKKKEDLKNKLKKLW